MHLADMARAIGGAYQGEDIAFQGLSIDSRAIQPGQLFVAIQGPRFDGHHYISKAIESGASAILISERSCLTDELQVPAIIVPDTTQALGDLAAVWRQQFDLPVIAMTGSCGKTSTKELTRAMLAQAGNVLATAGTLNNHWGLPLTLLQLDSKHDTAVLEMGANQLGDIEYLAKIAKPNIAMVLNVAPVHIEGFKSVENIAREKGQIYAYLQPGDWAILNRDDTFYDFWLSRLPAGVKVLTFGLSSEADIFATNIQMKQGQAQFTLNHQGQQLSLELSLLGEYQVYNALAAATIGIAIGLSLDKIKMGLQICTGVAGRMQKQTGKRGVQIVDDSYNANPTAVKAAINYLASCQGETMLVLGEMGELGPNAPELHAEIGAFAKERGIQHLWAVGPLCENAIKQFGKQGKWFPDKTSLTAQLEKIIHSSLTVLVKGSRTSQMETVIKALNSE